MRDRVLITESPIDVQNALAFVQNDGHGAVASFIGTVRDHNQGRVVTGINYDVFEPFALNVLQQLCEEVHEKWGDPLRLFIAHYRGWLEVGGVSVVITVGSPHRKEAFAACRYLIEELKQRCPIWKQEYFAEGGSAWVRCHDVGAKAV